MARIVNANMAKTEQAKAVFNYVLHNISHVGRPEYYDFDSSLYPSTPKEPFEN